MKKISLLVLVCVFTLLMGGCTRSVESTPAEDSSEAVSEISEVQSDMPEPAEQVTEFHEQNDRPQSSQISNVTPPGESEDIDQELGNLMTMFYTAYFNKDIDTIEQFLAEGFQDDVSVVGNEISSLEDVEIIEVKGWKNVVNKDNIGDECELSLEFKFPNEDSYTYLTVDVIKEDSSWKITWYGLEK